MKRDNSPPEAILVSGPNGAPGLVETSIFDAVGARRPGLGGGDGGAESRRVELERRQFGDHRRVEPRGGGGAQRGQRRRPRGDSRPRRRPARLRARRSAPHCCRSRRGAPAGRRARPASWSASTRCLRAMPRISNSRASAASSSAGRMGERAAARRRSSARPRRPRSWRGRCATSASASRGCASAIRSSRRAAWRSCDKPPSEPAEIAVERGEVVLDPRRRLHVAAAARRGAAPRPPRPRARRSRRSRSRAIRGRDWPRRARARAASSSAADVGQARPAARDGAAVDAAEAVEQGAVALGVEQAAIVVLAVDFDQPRARFAQRARGHRHPAGEGAAAAVGLQRAAQQQRLARFGARCPGRRASARLSWSGPTSNSAETTACPCPARTSAVSARAPSARPERVEQDRLARPGLAGEHAKPGFEIEVERLDEDDIADGELPQHRPRCSLAARHVALDQLVAAVIPFAARIIARRAPPRPCVASPGMPRLR